MPALFACQVFTPFSKRVVFRASLCFFNTACTQHLEPAPQKISFSLGFTFIGRNAYFNFKSA
jgi:hypothetical protein